MTMGAHLVVASHDGAGHLGRPLQRQGRCGEGGPDAKSIQQLENAPRTPLDAVLVVALVAVVAHRLAQGDA
jgi:hypothetical protein